MLVACAAFLLATSLHAQSKTLRIAAAADLQPVLPALVAHFEKVTGYTATVSYASSATLATQILNGAPYDLFLAANRAFPQKIIDAKLAVEAQPSTYAQGTLVLWVRRGIFSRTPIAMQMLTDAKIHHIAVADPVHAPYGAAAMAAIHSLGLTSALQPKLVYAENIAQAAQFGQSGNADAALLSKTLAITPTMQRAGEFVVVPKDAYPPIEQCAVVMKNATGQQAALDFLQTLHSDAARKLLASRGLEAPTK